MDDVHKKTDEPCLETSSPSNHKETMNFVITNRAEESEIYPLTVREIAKAQKDDTFHPWKN